MDIQPFEEETIAERLYALTEIFPDPMKNFASKSVSASKWIFSQTRRVSWFLCSTAIILVLPLSIEMERHEYEQDIRRKEREIILGPNPMI